MIADVNVTHCLKHPSGAHAIAYFRVLPNDIVHVVANVGWTGCYDDRMSGADARAVWKKLRAKVSFDDLREMVRD